MSDGGETRVSSGVLRGVMGELAILGTVTSGEGLESVISVCSAAGTGRQIGTKFGSSVVVVAMRAGDTNGVVRGVVPRMLLVSTLSVDERLRRALSSALSSIACWKRSSVIPSCREGWRV